MSMPIDIETLLNKQRIESERIEFKRGWNPASVYRTICAFANDFENLGGGYVLVGVEQDERGVAKRPVVGIEDCEIDGILKDMVAYNNKFDPFYQPRMFVESIDEKKVLAIWIPSGVYRPYAVPSDITVKGKCEKAYYIRSGTSSVVAKGESLDQLRDMANRTPFDERPNPNISLTDISMVLLRDYLAKVNSKLEQDLFKQPLEQTLEQMDLMTGPTENRMLKNVAAMMFCETPEKFFKYMQVDVVVFPEGRIRNPQRFTEKTFKGSVPQLIKQTMDYLRTNILFETVQKVAGRAEAKRFWNYPYEALEEAVVNSLYHRDYSLHEPVEISIEPDGIDILNCPGPDYSIPMAAIEKGDYLKSRRYRNRRLGDFLKELELTEGRSTGVPTIQEKLAQNGSPRATFETTEDRLSILIHIPVHEGCGDVVVMKSAEGSLKNSDNTEKWPKKWPKKWPEIASKIMEMISSNSKISVIEMESLLNVGHTTIKKIINEMQNEKMIQRIGPNKGGHWETTK